MRQNVFYAYLKQPMPKLTLSASSRSKFYYLLKFDFVSKNGYKGSKSVFINTSQI